MVKNIKQVQPKPTVTLIRSTVTAAVASLLILGCSSNPTPPTQQITAAESAISHAEQARVADYDSPELSDARDNLAAARDSVAKDEMTRARRYAEQAKINADLAAAKADAAKAKAVNYELAKGTTAVQQELQRNTGAK
ncbi:MAG: DUF4398 domain-containing protein [Cellvibrio sp.]